MNLTRRNENVQEPRNFSSNVSTSNLAPIASDPEQNCMRYDEKSVHTKFRNHRQAVRKLALTIEPSPKSNGEGPLPGLAHNATSIPKVLQNT